jgi:DNA-binding transcriptional MerR regulator
MTVHSSLRTRDLALAGSISVQQVRNYEANGLIPKAPRSPSGYRLYTRQHLAALHTLKGLVRGYGWQRTSAIMQALHRGDLPVALAFIDERHAELARMRLRVEETLVALRTLAAEYGPLYRPQASQSLRVGGAAKQVGVRVSAVHFWEQHGLIRPLREPHSRYRLYDEHQMRHLRVVALLRHSGYPFDVIRSVLDQMAGGRPEQAIVAVEKRCEDLTRISWTCIEGLTMFHHYASQFGPNIAGSERGFLELENAGAASPLAPG